MAGCGIELFWWERDLISLTDGMRDSFDGGIRDEQHAENHTSRRLRRELQLLPGGIGIKFLVERDGGIAKMRQRIVVGCGIEKTMLDSRYLVSPFLGRRWLVTGKVKWFTTRRRRQCC